MKSPLNVNQRRGTALIAVILMFVLVAAAVTAMGLLFSTEAKRTHTALGGARLRQLLLAAAPAAAQELSKSGSTDRNVTVPTPVEGATLVLRVRPLDQGRAEVRAIAKTPSLLAAQTLTYARNGDNWTLQSATLGPNP